MLYGKYLITMLANRLVAVTPRGHQFTTLINMINLRFSWTYGYAHAHCSGKHFYGLGILTYATRAIDPMHLPLHGAPGHYI